MTIFHVHLYREMRLYYPNIDAETHEAAADIAKDQPTDQAASIEDCDGSNTGALVDLDGDSEYLHSRLIDFDSVLMPQRGAQ
jgi:hypothetical protein